MITIKQTYKKVEAGHGEITCVFVISDKHQGLFLGMSGYIDTSGLTGTYSTGYTIDGVAVTGISKAAECVVSMTGHGFLDGEIKRFSGTSGASWDAVFKDQYFIVSDKTNDTFKIKHADIDINLFTIGDVEEKISDKIGGMITSQLSFEINEHNVKTPTDAIALQFVIDALNPSIFRYCGLFFDPVQTTRAQDESRHLGVIQPEINDDALVWKSAPWASDTGAINKRKLTAKPIFSDIFDALKIKDLILGSTDDPQTIPGIDSTWETNNVADRFGWFYRVMHDGDPTEYTETVKIYKLYNLNALLRKLADNTTTALATKGFGNFSIIYDRSPLDGQWLPARWNHQSEVQLGFTRYPRFVSWWSSPSQQTYYVHADDAQTLCIDPDGNDATFTGTGLNDLSVSGEYTAKTRVTFRIQIDGNGTPDTFKWSIDDGATWEDETVAVTAGAILLSDGISVTFAATTGHTIGDYWEVTPATKYESVWLHYQNIKEFMDYEPIPSKVDGYLWYNNIESFTELISAIAQNFGVFAKFYYTDANTLHIQFISRGSMSGSQVYVKDVEKASRKITGNSRNAEKFQATSGYLAPTGNDFYIQEMKAQPISTLESRGITTDPKKRLLMTISPTTELNYDGYDDIAFYDTNCKFPHNHIAMRLFPNGDIHLTPKAERAKNASGLHTAIYMYVDTRDGQIHEEHGSYFTPAAAVTIKIDDIEKSFDKLENYINFLYNRDESYFQSEFNIDMPFWNVFSASSDGSNQSWRNLRFGMIISLDEIDYIINSIKFKGDKCFTSIVCQGAQRFSNIVDPLVPQIQQPVDMVLDIGHEKIHTAGSNLSFVNVVSLDVDESVEQSSPAAGNHGKIYGIAMKDTASGNNLIVKTEGIIENPDWEELINDTINAGDILTLKYPDVSTFNIELNGEMVSGELYCRIGIFETNTRLRIEIKEFMVE
jgi:hypothetical protein